jgi:hypothetical protein
MSSSQEQEQQEQEQEQQIVQSKILERLQMYQDVMVENKNLLDELLVRLPRCRRIDMALLSRLDDIMEDIMTLNADTKNVLNGLEEDNLTLSARDPERNAFNRQIKTFLPLLFFWHNMQQQLTFN